MHNTCIKHGRDNKTQFFGSTSILLLRTGLTFSQTRSNDIILQGILPAYSESGYCEHETLPAYCIPKVVRMEIAEVLYEKVYMSPRPPP